MNWINGTYPLKRDIQHYRGDSVAQADFTFEHPYGASSNIDEAIFTVRSSEDGAALYSLALSVVASQWDFSTVGTGKLQILDTDTDGLAGKSRVTNAGDGEYVYDIQLQHTDGRTVTVLYGRYTLWADVSHAGGGGGLETHQDRQLKAWAVSGAWWPTVAPTYDAIYTDLIASASIEWPDGSTGTYTTVTIDDAWEEVLSFTISHVDSGKTVSISKSARDEEGRHISGITVSVG